jgi:malate permease and related proteins
VASLLILMVCFSLGVAGRRLPALPDTAPRVLNTWVLYVSLPALVLKVVHGVAFEAGLVVAAACLWLCFSVAAALGVVAFRRGWATREVAGAAVLCAGLGNTAFVGLPLLEAYGGPSTTAPAAVVDQLGSFFAFSLLAVPFATVMGGHSLRPLAVLRRVALFPPFVALLVALLSRGWAYPQPLTDVLDRLASMLTPLALASVGYQLDVTSFRGTGRLLVVGLGYKLVVAPLLTLGLLWALRPQFGLVERIGVAQAAMAPMVTAGVLAAEHRFSGQVASAMIAVGVPLSFLTVWLWWGALP